MLNYYRRSLPNIATVLQPLYEVATKKMEKGEKFEWNPTLQEAFDTSKTRLKNHALLVHPDPKAPLAIVTDASGKELGGSLEQFDDRKNT